jgi:hypothetical protein
VTVAVHIAMFSSTMARAGIAQCHLGVEPPDPNIKSKQCKMAKAANTIYAGMLEHLQNNMQLNSKFSYKCESSNMWYYNSVFCWLINYITSVLDTAHFSG